MRWHSPLIVFALLAGCGQRAQLGTVEGTVRAGGKPLAGVVVRFHPEAKGASAAVRSVAQSDADGRYRLQTEDGQSGAVVGKHRVTVEDLAILSAPRSPDGTVLQRPPVRFSPSYSDPLRSPLTFEVQMEPQKIDIELKAGP